LESDSAADLNPDHHQEKGTAHMQD